MGGCGHCGREAGRRLVCDAAVHERRRGVALVQAEEEVAGAEADDRGHRHLQEGWCASPAHAAHRAEHPHAHPRVSRAVKSLQKAQASKDADGALAALSEARGALVEYRTVAKIDNETGGALDTTAFESKSGSKLTGSGYVVPVFRGGAQTVGVGASDYALR